MPKKEKKSILSKGTILSIILHVVVIGFLLFWGVTNTNESGGPIEVSLSSGDFGPGGPESDKKTPGASSSPEKETPKNEPEEEVKKAEEKKEVVEKKEPEKVVEKKEEKAEKIPEKVVEKKKEPEKEEVKKEEVVKKEPVEEKKKIAIPEKKIEEEKKEVVKKEPPKKQEPAEKVIEKKETEKEVQPEKEVAKEVSNESESDSSRENVLKDIKRKSVLRDLKNKSVKTSEQVASRNEASGGGDTQAGGGGGASGTSSRINPIVLSTYYEVLSKRVEKVLAFPPSVELDGSFTTFVRFWMNNNGRVTNVAVDKSSGNNIIDNYCVKAVNSAAPFPSPPVEIRSRIKSEPFVIPCKNES